MQRAGLIVSSGGSGFCVTTCPARNFAQYPRGRHRYFQTLAGFMNGNIGDGIPLSDRRDWLGPYLFVEIIEVI